MAEGSHPATRVELVRRGETKAFFHISGNDTETLRREVVALKEQQGRTIFIRIVDEQSGYWGHVNFDDFRFHAQRPKFENEIEVKLAEVAPPADMVRFAGLEPEAAAAAATVPEGFSMKVFAAEPHVQQPIAF